MNAAPAGENAAAFQFEENLLEIFYGDAMARSDLVDGDDFRIFHGEMENRLRRVLAFGRNSHGMGLAALGFHRGTRLSIQEARFG